MGEILHQNSKGVMMMREDFKFRSQVKVVSEYAGKRYSLRTYRFKYIHDPIEIPYCSWANLDCCGGWSFDEEYLDTAVQKGLKLFSGRTTFLRKANERLSPFPTQDEAIRKFQGLQKELPEGIFAEIDDEQPNSNYLHTHICRAGRIINHIDLAAVFEFYEKLGWNISTDDKKEIERLCGIEIKQYGTSQAPFQYTNAESDAELITTGLLLGYPIESTVSILQGY